MVQNNHDNDFNDNKLTNIDSVTVNRNPSSDNEVANKTCIEDELDKNTIVRFNQTLQYFLKVFVGNNSYNLTKYDKIQFIDTTIIKYPNAAAYLYQNWVIKCNGKNNNRKIQNFVRSTKTNSPTSDSGATSLPPIGNALMFFETSSINHGQNVFRSFERTDIIQISNKTFYFNRFSILTDDSLESMGRFRIQLLLEDNTWSNR